MKLMVGLFTMSFLVYSAFADACDSRATLQRLTGLFGTWGYTVVDFGPHDVIGFSSTTCTFPNLILKDSFGSQKYTMSFRIEPGTGITDLRWDRSN